MKKIWNKYKMLFFFLLILGFMLVLFLIRQVIDYDELWNYSFAKNIADGLVPYKDFNMVQTPLYPMINSVFLRIWNELIMMRILGAVLSSLIIIMIYKVYKVLDVKPGIAVFLSLVILLYFGNLWSTDYNFASLALVLLIIYLEIKAYKKENDLLKINIKNELLLGILAGSILMFKQTVGLTAIFILLFHKLLALKKKGNIKKMLKIIGLRILGVLIPVVFVLIYLLANGALNDFINYTIKGLNGFSNHIPYNYLFGLGFTGVLAIVIPLTYIITGVKLVVSKKKDNVPLYIMLLYGLSTFVLAFPISDEIHFKIGGVIGIMILLYLLYGLVEKYLNKKILNFGLLIIRILIYLVLIGFMGYNISRYCSTPHHRVNHYHYLPVGVSDYEISIVDQYIIKNDPVLILDASAPIWFIPIDRYHKDYDMLLKGNLGADPVNRLTEDLKNSDKRQYLVLKDDYAVNWQLELKVVEYVKNEKNRVGEIDVFDVYE